MIIKVTQEHINKGKKYKCFYCPIALSLHPYNSDLSAHAGGIIGQGNGRKEYREICTLEEHAAEFIRAFDLDSTKPKPIEFHISAESLMV